MDTNRNPYPVLGTLAVPAHQAGSTAMTTTSATCNPEPPWHESCAWHGCDPSAKALRRKG